MIIALTIKNSDYKKINSSRLKILYDIHRKTLITYLRQKGLSPKLRRIFMDWYDDEFTTTGPFGRPKPVREFENYFFIPIPLFVKYFLVDRLDDVSKYINFEKAKTLWKYQFKIYIDAHTGKTIPEYMVDKNDIYRPLKAQKYREKSIESTNEYLIL